MCGAPSTIFHLGHIVVVLRRSPVSVEHQHRYHAVVLTKLSLNTWLDRSSRDVIGLNVVEHGGVVRSALDRIFRDLNRREYDSINRIFVMLLLSNLQGYEDALPLSRC